MSTLSRPEVKRTRSTQNWRADPIQRDTLSDVSPGKIGILFFFFSFPFLRERKRSIKQSNTRTVLGRSIMVYI
jgi:hypothetical protein